MIVLKYEKGGEARFISHIDLLRHISRILSRAEIPVRRSNGFNPHALVYFSPPLALGAASTAEYLVIDCDMQKDEALARFNASAQRGLRATEAFCVKKNPNLQAKVVAADYIYPYPYRELDLSCARIEYSKKGENVVEDVSSKILRATDVDGALCLRLATGGVNLRPDRLLPLLNGIYERSESVLGITKFAQYVLEDGELIDADDFLRHAGEAL